MNMMDIERAARAAWPALEEQELPFGVLRYSRCSDRRSNSLSLYPRADFEIEELVGSVETFFSKRGAAPIVRILKPKSASSEKFEEVDRALHLRGYAKQAPTITMLLDLDRSSMVKPRMDISKPESVSVESWLHAWYTLSGRPVAKLHDHKALLLRSKLSQRYLLATEDDGVPVCSGMAVRVNQSMGLFGISTAIKHRNKGYAHEVLGGLLEWGVKNAARFVYLQVEENNVAAINLYQKLGFKKSYSYWYRVGKQSTGKTGG